MKASVRAIPASLLIFVAVYSATVSLSLASASPGSVSEPKISVQLGIGGSIVDVQPMATTPPFPNSPCKLTKPIIDRPVNAQDRWCVSTAKSGITVEIPVYDVRFAVPKSVNCVTLSDNERGDFASVFIYGDHDKLVQCDIQIAQLYALTAEGGGGAKPMSSGKVQLLDVNIPWSSVRLPRKELFLGIMTKSAEDVPVVREAIVGTQCTTMMALNQTTDCASLAIKPINYYYTGSVSYAPGAWLVTPTPAAPPRMFGTPNPFPTPPPRIHNFGGDATATFEQNDMLVTTVMQNDAASTSSRNLSQVQSHAPISIPTLAPTASLQSTVTPYLSLLMPDAGLGDSAIRGTMNNQPFALNKSGTLNFGGAYVHASDTVSAAAYYGLQGPGYYTQAYWLSYSMPTPGPTPPPSQVAPQQSSALSLPADATSVTAHAVPADPPADFGSAPSGEYEILYNDHHVYTKPDVLKQGRVLAALVKDGMLLIPLRSMFEQMGATVSYDAGTKTATVSKPNAEIKVTVGKPQVVINGESRPLDVPPMIYQGAVLVPVRVISEGMGAYVLWVPDRRLVVVRYIPATPPPSPAPPPPPPPPRTPPPATSVAGPSDETKFTPTSFSLISAHSVNAGQLDRVQGLALNYNAYQNEGACGSDGKSYCSLSIHFFQDILRDLDPVAGPPGLPFNNGPYYSAFTGESGVFSIGEENNKFFQVAETFGAQTNNQFFAPAAGSTTWTVPLTGPIGHVSISSAAGQMGRSTTLDLMGFRLTNDNGDVATQESGMLKVPIWRSFPLFLQIGSQFQTMSDRIAALQQGIGQSYNQVFFEPAPAIADKLLRIRPQLLKVANLASSFGNDHYTLKLLGGVESGYQSSCSSANVYIHPCTRDNFTTADYGALLILPDLGISFGATNASAQSFPGGASSSFPSGFTGSVNNSAGVQTILFNSTNVAPFSAAYTNAAYLQGIAAPQRGSTVTSLVQCPIADWLTLGAGYFNIQVAPSTRVTATPPPSQHGGYVLLSAGPKQGKSCVP